MAMKSLRRPIRWIVPFVPGGSTTVIARLLGQKLTESWGQQVVVASIKLN